MEYKGLKSDLAEQLQERVIQHRDRFAKIFYYKYLEMLPSLIGYKNIEATSIDFLKVEVALMNNHDVVIGQANNGKIQVLGLTTSRDTSENPVNLFTTKLLNKNNIKFVIPTHLIPQEMKEISFQDDCKTGNFVVLRNKTLNYVSDIEIIKHYTAELAEVVLSRYSLTMQTKILTFFLGDENDTTTDKLVSDLYNGAPMVKASKLFDPDENIVHMQNDNISQVFTELKSEYQNRISELNNMLGINSLAVEKESGITDTEAKSNRSFTTAIANIKIESRNTPINKLNKRFGRNIEVVYNDEVASELNDVIKEEENDEIHDNSL